MSLRLVLPLGKKEGVKNIVFTILSREYPLKLIEVTNFVRKRYGKAVTFQAVRKAVLELVEEGVLVKKDNSFSINKEWIYEAKKTLDEIYSAVYQEKTKPKSFDSIGDEVSVFNFDSLGSMMKFWQNLIDEWFVSFKPGDYNMNAWQGAHMWEAIMYPENEKKIMSQLKNKGIKSYVLFTHKTALNKIAAEFYRKLGVKVDSNPSFSSFDKEYYVGTYGDLVVQTRYPKEINILIDAFFKKAKDLSKLDINELADIINKKVEIKLSVTKNLDMAKQINHSIISQIS